MKPITEFLGEYRFLSSFWPTSTVFVDDIPCRTLEHGYHALKTENKAQRREILETFSPGAAKRLGSQVDMRDNWDEIKIDIMLDLLRQKFKDPALRKRLIATGDSELIEGNTWNDTFWGVCKGRGSNHLGRLLMMVRKEVAQEEFYI